MRMHIATRNIPETVEYMQILYVAAHTVSTIGCSAGEVKAFDIKNQTPHTYAVSYSFTATQASKQQQSRLEKLTVNCMPLPMALYNVLDWMR